METEEGKLREKTSVLKTAETRAARTFLRRQRPSSLSDGNISFLSVINLQQQNFLQCRRLRTDVSIIRTGSIVIIRGRLFPAALVSGRQRQDVRQKTTNMETCGSLLVQYVKCVRGTSLFLHYIMYLLCVYMYMYTYIYIYENIDITFKMNKNMSALCNLAFC